MTQLITGSQILGHGIDIYGDLGIDSLKVQVFDMSSGAATKTIEGVEFQTPKNASIIENNRSEGQTYVFSDRHDYDRHFAAKVEVSGSTLSFKASAEASFDRTRKTSNTSVFGIYEANFLRYDLLLDKRGEEALAESLKNDAIYKNLPNSLTEGNAFMFFRLFEKYGTHFLSRVSMGGRINYSVATRSGHSYSSKEIETKLTAEYNGVFASAKTETSTDFKEANEDWFNSSIRKVSAEGGNTDVVALITPVPNKNYYADFVSWVKSVETDPSVLSVQFSSIDQAFSGDKAAAVSEALTKYKNSTLEVQASIGTSEIRLMGKPLPIKGSQGASEPFGRFQIAIINRNTLKLEFGRTWELGGHDPGPGYVRGDWNLLGDGVLEALINRTKQAYAEAYESIKPYEGKNDFIQVFSAVGVCQMLPPGITLLIGDKKPIGSEFKAFLRGSGAGAVLDDWTKKRSEPNGRAMYGKSNRVNYICVGVCGSTPGSGIEACDPPYTYDYSDDDPESIMWGSVDLWLFLEPIVSGDGKWAYHARKIDLPPGADI